ncbi:aldo/keto reductase [Candidatus Dojkabacteria bacterium]|nr:aldo/keto reductase [Candidatus Dojkabacteria bacterium]
MNKQVEKKKLNHRSKIPVLGFGTWKLKGTECQNAVFNALKVGYRHIDTADAYKNHQEVGKAINGSGIKRDEIFLTSKVWRTSLNPEDLKKDTKRFLDELDTDYLDLLLVHWPNDDVPISDTIGAMKELKTEGLVNHIGVSNFTALQLKILLNSSQHILGKDISIANHQFEFHPTLQQKELVKFSHQNDISVTAYSPLGHGQDLEIKKIKDIAGARGCTEAQVILAWIRQKGIIAIPRSSDPKHIQENFESLNVELSDEDLGKIDTLDNNNRIVNPSFSPFGK